MTFLHSELSATQISSLKVVVQNRGITDFDIFTILQCNPLLLSVVSNIYLCVPQGQPRFIGLTIPTEYYKITQKGEIDINWEV